MSDLFNIGDIIQLKKMHPCGSKCWEIIRKGADIKIKCQGCDHILMIERHRLEKMLKKT